jgi:quercetin dioxygenase-like cupin family protein
MRLQATRNVGAILTIGLALLSFAPALVAQKLHNSRPAARTEARNDPGLKKLLSNERLNVVRLEVAPHQSTAVDRHAHDYLIIALNEARLEAVGSINSFELEMESGEMQVMKGGWPHQLKNQGEQPSHLLEVEVFKNIEPERAVCGLSRRTCTDGEFRRTEEGSYSTSTLFETPTVKLKKVYISPGGSLPRHGHAGGDVIIALTSLKLGDDFNNESDVRLDAGQVHWLGPGADHGPRNVGAEEARFLELELK